MEVKDLIGIKYESAGRTLYGLDCWGIVYQFHKQILKQEIPALYGQYDDATNRVQVSNTVARNKSSFKNVFYESRKFGDILVFNIRKCPVHVGIVLNSDKMIHTLAGHNSCVENYNEVVWGSRLEGIYRWEK